IGPKVVRHRPKDELSRRYIQRPGSTKAHHVHFGEGLPMLVLVFLLGFSALALALVLTPVTRKVALRFGFVDRPDLRRKLHATPTPRIGGVAVVLAYVGALTGVALITGAA